MKDEDKNFPIIHKKTDTLKLIAIITMLIDHIGAVFFPQYIILRVIGRFAFPIFAFHIAMGYRRTSNVKNYGIRLLVFGILSQVPYDILFDSGLNIFFTLFLSLICIYGIDRKKYFLLAFALTLPMILDFEYGYYGIFTVLSFYDFWEDERSISLSLLLLNSVYFLYYNFSIQIISLVALVFINREWKAEIKLNKYLYYIFYPLHISILYLIQTL